MWWDGEKRRRIGSGVAAPDSGRSDLARTISEGHVRFCLQFLPMIYTFETRRSQR